MCEELYPELCGLITSCIPHYLNFKNYSTWHENDFSCRDVGVGMSHSKVQRQLRWHKSETPCASAYPEVGSAASQCQRHIGIVCLSRSGVLASSANSDPAATANSNQPESPCRGWRFQVLFRRSHLPFWQHTHYGKAMLHIKRDSVSGKQLRSFSLCRGHLLITGL